MIDYWYGPVHYFGGGGDTLVSVPALCLFVVCSVLMLSLPRKHVIMPFLVAVILIPLGDQIVVGGVHFMLLRCLLLVGWARMTWRTVLTRRDPFPGPLNSLDKTLIAWALSNAITFTILWGAFQAFVNRLGFLYTAFGAYFLLRYLIRDRDDIVRTVETLAMICAVLAAFMLREHFTGHNSFSVLGGVPEISEVRYGKVRAHGPFIHPIIAGTFGAMLLPLFVAVWSGRKGHRTLGTLGLVSSPLIAFASTSSTPLMTILAGTFALCLWPFRKSMRAVRWGLVLALVALEIVMKADVWFLIARVSALMGGTGWQRAELIDNFVRRFGDWWMVGTRSNANWGADMWDSINGYVNAGLEGGLVTFLLYIAVFVSAYRTIGLARRSAEGDRKREWLIWALGAALFANTVAFFGITYFDQSAIVWYALLSMMSVASILATEPQSAPVAVPMVCEPGLAPADEGVSAVPWASPAPPRSVENGPFR